MYWLSHVFHQTSPYEVSVHAEVMCNLPLSYAVELFGDLYQRRLFLVVVLSLDIQCNSLLSVCWPWSFTVSVSCGAGQLKNVNAKKKYLKYHFILHLWISRVPTVRYMFLIVKLHLTVAEFLFKKCCMKEVFLCKCCSFPNFCEYIFLGNPFCTLRHSLYPRLHKYLHAVFIQDCRIS